MFGSENTQKRVQNLTISTRKRANMSCKLLLMKAAITLAHVKGMSSQAGNKRLIKNKKAVRLPFHR